MPYTISRQIFFKVCAIGIYNVEKRAALENDLCYVYK